MELEGKIVSVDRDMVNGTFKITLVTDDNSFLAELKEYTLLDRVAVTISKVVRHRSLNANALLWDCIGKIAKSMKPPAKRWDVYLQLLKDYGTYEYIIVKPKDVERTKKQWRETEVIGPISVNGEDAVQLLCYYGSHTYTTKEFSVLLDGTIDEMVQLGLQPPTSEKMQRSLELWEKSQSQ